MIASSQSRWAGWSRSPIKYLQRDSKASPTPGAEGGWEGVVRLGGVGLRGFRKVRVAVCVIGFAFVTCDYSL